MFVILLFVIVNEIRVKRSKEIAVNDLDWIFEQLFFLPSVFIILKSRDEQACTSKVKNQYFESGASASLLSEDIQGASESTGFVLFLQKCKTHTSYIMNKMCYPLLNRWLIL